MQKITSVQKKTLLQKARLWLKNLSGLKGYVFELIGDWKDKPTFKELNGKQVIDSPATTTGIQPDMVLEVLEEAKLDKAAPSTVRNWINASKPDDFKNPSQSGQTSPGKKQANLDLTKWFGGIETDNDDKLRWDRNEAVEIGSSYFVEFQIPALEKHGFSTEVEYLTAQASAAESMLRALKERKAEAKAEAKLHADVAKLTAQSDKESMKPKTGKRNNKPKSVVTTV